ncbi:MAG: hypothetical protein MZV63_52485 [Marinilabiliales bacterium]|nr:hypothetical protein [Marinilabiliales bacterium]
MSFLNMYVVAYCTRVQEEGLAPVEDVTSDIRFILGQRRRRRRSSLTK